MKTYLDCIPCFFKQALEACRIAGMSARGQKKIVDKLAQIIPDIALNASPPEMGRVIYRLVSTYSHKKDIYRHLKEKSNRLALRIYSRLKNKINHSRDRLLTAVELAVKGNIIDYGAKNRLDVDNEIKKILVDKNTKIKKQNKSVFDYNIFKNSIVNARTILYLGDNAGETVFDRLLIEEIKNMNQYKRIIYAVKECSVINDALIEDAYISGIDKIAEVVSCGSDAPGTVLYLCSKKFMHMFDNADLVISKGQGNYEALSDVHRPIFFLFVAKCPVIAKDALCNIGDINLLYHSGKIK